MRSDDELLSHIRKEAGVRQHRRQRAMVGAAAAAVVLLLGAGALAASVSDDDQSVMTEEGETTSTVEETTTTEEPTSTTEAETTTTTTTTTTSPPVSDTVPPETEPPTTTLPPIAPVSETSAGPEITLTVTATQDRARPGWVGLAIRVESPHGSSPTGYARWEGEDVFEAEGFGWWEGGVWPDCLPPEDPETGEFLPYPPDPDPGPVDDTYTEAHQYEPDAGTVTIDVLAIVSYCYSDSSETSVTLEVPIGG